MNLPIPQCAPQCTVTVKLLVREGQCETISVRDIYVLGFEFDERFCQCFKFDEDRWLSWKRVLQEVVKQFRGWDLIPYEYFTINLKYPPCGRVKKIVGGGIVNKNDKSDNLLGNPIVYEGSNCVEDTCCIHKLVMRNTKPYYIIDDQITMGFDGICPVDSISETGDTIRCVNICKKIKDPQQRNSTDESTENDGKKTYDYGFFIADNKIVSMDGIVRLPFINIDGKRRNWDISIFDITGDLVQSIQNYASSNQVLEIDISNMKNGFYYMYVQSKESLLSFQIKIILLK
jgi:hypothetical protein